MVDYLAIIRKPLFGTDHCGEFKPYSDEYQQLQSAFKRGNWNEVVELGRAAFKEWKGLGVAVQLCIASFSLEGFDGLAMGLEGCRILLKDYWDGLFPKTLNQRAAALHELNTRLGGNEKTPGLIEDSEKATADVQDALKKAKASVDALNRDIQSRCLLFSMESKFQSVFDTQTVSEPLVEVFDKEGFYLSEEESKTAIYIEEEGRRWRLVDYESGQAFTVVKEGDRLDVYPSIFYIAQAILHWPKKPESAQQQTDTAENKLPEGDEEQQSHPDPGSETASQGSSTREASQLEGQTVSARGEWKTADEAIKSITQAVVFLRDHDPTDPRPYRVLRALRWGQITGIPFVRKPKKSKEIDYPFSAQNHQDREKLDKLMESQNWTELLKQAEGLFMKGASPWWLDLQYYIDAALKGLGAKYQPVRDVIRQETAMFVNRLPEVLELSFRSGQPLANEKTKTWIQQEVRSPLNPGAVIAPETSVDLMARSTSGSSATVHQVHVGDAHVEVIVKVYK